MCHNAVLSYAYSLCIRPTCASCYSFSYSEELIASTFKILHPYLFIYIVKCININSMNITVSRTLIMHFLKMFYGPLQVFNFLVNFEILIIVSC